MLGRVYHNSKQLYYNNIYNMMQMYLYDISHTERYHTNATQNTLHKIAIKEKKVYTNETN